MKNFGTGLVDEIKLDNNKDKTSNNDHNLDNLFSRVVRCKGEVWLSNADCCPIDAGKMASPGWVR